MPYVLELLFHIVTLLQPPKGTSPKMKTCKAGLHSYVPDPKRPGCHECARERQRAYNAAHREERNAYYRAYREANPEKCKAYEATHYAANRDKRKAKSAAYRAANPEAVSAVWHTRRARKLGIEGSFTAEEWRAIKGRQNGRCALCQAECDLTVDHIVPLARGGTNFADNIQGLCGTCNRSKGDKLDYGMEIAA